MAITEHAYPLDSIVNYDGNGVPSFDRAVSSMVLRNLIHGLFTDGILMPENSTSMQVVENNNMTVKVNAGFCVIQGAMRTFADKTLSITAAHTTLDRIDTVVARLNLNQDVRDILLYVVAGTPAENPVRPTLTRTDSIYELGLADLYITRNTTSISAERITDTRLDTARCGVVSSISEFDTTTLYNQIQADLAHFKNENEADFSAWSTNQKNAFITWFDTIKGILDGDVAGHLQNEIDQLNTSKANKSDITHISITGTTNNTGSNILAGTLFYLNGTLCKALTNIASGATLTSGTNYTGTTINSNLTDLVQSGTATLSYASANYLQSQHIPLNRKGMKIVASLNSQIGSTEPFQIVATVDDTGEPFGSVLVYSPNGVFTHGTIVTVNWIAH